MFRLQDNAPEVYVNNSRDFQLFCRMYDSLHNGVKYSIDTISKTSSTGECPVTVLPLLKTKLGMFDSIDASDYETTMVLQAFPALMRNKGTMAAIEDIVIMFHRLSHDIDTPPTIEKNPNGDDSDHIHIIFQSAVSNEDLLNSLLKLVAPLGCKVTYEITKIGNAHTTVKVSNKVAFRRYDLERDGVSVVFRHASLSSGRNSITFNNGMSNLSLTYRVPVSGEYLIQCDGLQITEIRHIGENEPIDFTSSPSGVVCEMIKNGSYEITFHRNDASDFESYSVNISAPLEEEYLETDALRNTVGLTYVANGDSKRDEEVIE